MAKVDLLNAKGRAYFLFYNLDQAVGKGCPNRKDDVLLAQYLMVGASQKVPGLIGLYPGGGMGWDVDGIWDNEWDGVLDYYQSEWKKRGPKTWPDRRIDPVPSHIWKASPIHHVQYFIMTLNMLFGDLRPQDFPRLSEAKDCPAELRPFIRVHWMSDVWAKWLPNAQASTPRTIP